MSHPAKRSSKSVRISRDRWRFSQPAFSPDGSKILTAGTDGSAQIWGRNQRTALCDRFPGHIVASIAVFSPDGSKVATAGIEGKMFVWDALTGGKSFSTPAVAAERENSEINAGSASHAAFALGERVAARVAQLVGLHPATASMWRPARDRRRGFACGIAESGREVSVRSKFRRTAIRSVAFGPDSTMLLTAEDRATRIWGFDVSE